jgi:hypothetical protein
MHRALRLLDNNVDIRVRSIENSVCTCYDIRFWLKGSPLVSSSSSQGLSSSIPPESDGNQDEDNRSDNTSNNSTNIWATIGLAS